MFTQITLASFFNFEINSSTDSTLTPPLRFGGSLTEVISTRNSGSTFNELNSIEAIFFFFACIIFGNVANRGSFNLKSVESTAGSLNVTVSSPPSISLIASTSSPFIVNFDTDVAWFQFKKPASIGPVCAASSSIACFPTITNSCFSLFKYAAIA
eukprot:NODE_1004_length_2718_cov_0.682321.p3 type:complete len:155 gc:universal NODE_1004_length_2718_cov_0.682321:1874-1410(-)